MGPSFPGMGCWYFQMILINSWPSKSTLPGFKQPGNVPTNKAALCLVPTKSGRAWAMTLRAMQTPHCKFNRTPGPRRPHDTADGKMGPGLSSPSSSPACRFPLSPISSIPCDLVECILHPGAKQAASQTNPASVTKRSWSGPGKGLPQGV